jgi:hypothetical protein
MSKQHPARLARAVNLTECIRIAKQLGCKVEPVHGTGDIRFSHPLMPKPMNANGRRKSTPRKVTAWINKVTSLLQHHAAA